MKSLGTFLARRNYYRVTALWALMVAVQVATTTHPLWRI